MAIDLEIERSSEKERARDRKKALKLEKKLDSSISWWIFQLHEFVFSLFLSEQSSINGKYEKKTKLKQNEKR